MQQLSIRRTKREDFDGVADLFALWVSEDITHGEAIPAAVEFERWMSEICFVAEIKNQIIGVLVATETIHNTSLGVIPGNTRVIHLEELYVHPEYRNQQVGTKLLSRMFSEAKKRKVDHFLLYSATKDWRKIIKFYERQGFEFWNFQMFKRPEK
ncbi:MAG: GNAT family N-acetyltransferase [Candidatus Hodarchaeota archaeon]